MFFYEGYSCPVCGESFKQSDDIVSCPDCGAPHHRECWKKAGKCFFHDAHGTPNQWTRETAQNITNEKTAHNNVCPNCGFENSDFSEFCSRCGQDLDGKDWTSVQKPNPPVPPVGYGEYRPFQMAQPFQNIPGNTDLDGVTADEMRRFVGQNASYYLPRFLKFSKGKSCISWNWSAFLLAPYWLWTRKQYLSGIFVLLFQLIQTFIAAFFSYRFLNLSADFTIQELYDVLATYAQNETLSKWMVILYLCTFVALLIDVFCGMFGNYFYYRTAVKRIKKLKQSNRADQIPYKGGFAFSLGAIIYCGVYFFNWLISLWFIK